MALNSSDLSLDVLEARGLTVAAWLPEHTSISGCSPDWADCSCGIVGNEIGDVHCDAEHRYYFGEVRCNGEVFKSSPEMEIRVVRIGDEESHRKALDNLEWFMIGG